MGICLPSPLSTSKSWMLSIANREKALHKNCNNRCHMQIIIPKSFRISRLFKKKGSSKEKRPTETSTKTLDILDSANQGTVRGAARSSDDAPEKVAQEGIFRKMVPRLEVMFARPSAVSQQQREQTTTVGMSDPSLLFDEAQPGSSVRDGISVKSINSSDSDYFTGRRVGIYIPSNVPNRDEPLGEDAEDSMIVSMVCRV